MNDKFKHSPSSVLPLWKITSSYPLGYLVNASATPSLYNFLYSIPDYIIIITGLTTHFFKKIRKIGITV